MMDREIPVEETPTTVPADRPAPMVAQGPVIVSVCTTC
jgi:hypothetical protein